MPRVSETKYRVDAGWDDVPHLNETTKKTLLASTPPYQRDARSKGRPSLGSGAIYPFSEDDLAVDPFPIPAHWRRAFGLDVGWKCTAAAFGAWDPEGDILYIYSEHYRGEARPTTHTSALQARGGWIPGVIDPAARGRGQRDGEQLMSDYVNLGLKLQLANNAVEAGLYAVWERMETGRLKVFRTCRNWFKEQALYRRDEKGRIVKVNDHIMDASRYLVMSGKDIAITEPVRGHTSAPAMGDVHAGY